MKRSLFVGIFVMALTTLLLELVLIRVFDVILTSNMSYMVITCAMFSFGLSGIYIVFRPLPSHKDTGEFLSLLAVFFSISTLLILPLINFLPFDYNKISKGPFIQVASFGGMYLSLIIPFFFSGLIFATIFSAFTNRIQSLYFWDLTGAGVGCIMLIPLISHIGPGGLIICASALGLFASALFTNKRVWSAVLCAIGAVVLFIPFSHMPSYFEFREHVDKRGVKEAKLKGDVELTRWDRISKIDIVDLEKHNLKHIAYDGGAQSSHFYPFDGDYYSLRENLPDMILSHFWMRGVLASHYLKKDSEQRVLIIGSAGGQETKAALMYGAKHVDAIEMVKTVVELGTGKYARYIGNIFNHPNVHVRTGEGRSFLRSRNDQYDIIQIFSNHTSSSIASGTGAMATTYLQTAEAYKEYFNHLTDIGILHINHHVYPKMITTAALAWKLMGRTNFRDHVVVFEKDGIYDTLPTLMIKMNPWTEAEMDTLIEFFNLPLKDKDTYKLVEDPLHPENSFLSSAFYSGDFPENLAKKIDFRIQPSTDDKPYFNFLRKKIELINPDPESFLNLSTAHGLNSQMRKLFYRYPFDFHVPMDIVHFFITGFFSLFFAMVFILLPLYFSRTGKSKWSQKASFMLYFSCLGAGFIIFELLFIQIFMKLVGYPLYTYSTVIFTLLLAAGIGSLTSKKLRITMTYRWAWPFIGIFAASCILLLTHNYIFNAFLSSPMFIRILVTVLMIFPLGFFLGIPFPLGILAIERQPRGTIAWAWGLNGFFTVVGGLLSVVFSILLGFRITLLIALAIYILAFSMFNRIRKESY